MQFQGWVGGLVLALLLVGCAVGGAAPTPVAVPGGDAERGRMAMEQYGCGACHTIPGVRGANATVGPPLAEWSRRHTIAGALPNTPDNLIRWVMEPQAIEPGTLMPNLEVSAPDARDIAAYLYGLR